MQVENVDDTGKTPARSFSDAQIPPKKTFWQSLAIFTGTHSDENLLTLLLAPIMVNVSRMIVLLFRAWRLTMDSQFKVNLGALWMVVVTGMLSSFYVSQSFVAAQIFAFPPYSLNAAGVGYLFVGPFIGALLGSIILAIIMDPLILWCTKRNGGIYEPEFRLIPVALGVIGGVGVLGYAAVLQARGNMCLASFLWGLDLFGSRPVYSQCKSSMLIQCYRNDLHPHAGQ